MGTPKIQNAYRDPTAQTEDIADLLLVTTDGLTTDGDAGVCYLVYHNGTDDVLVSSTAGLPVTQQGAWSVNGTVTANLGATDNAVLDAIAASTASIDTKAPALGQALAAASVPVVLTAAQVSTLTPPAAITGFALESGGNIAAIATNIATIEQTTESIATNQLPDGHNVTVSGSVTANIGTVGTLATATKQDTGNTSLATIATTVAALGSSYNSVNPGIPLLAHDTADGVWESLKLDDDLKLLVAATLIEGQGSLAGGSGTVGTNTLRVTLATNVALPAGTNNIGDVDVLSCALPTGASTLAEQQTQTAHLNEIKDFAEGANNNTALLHDSIVAVDTIAPSKVMMSGAVRDDALSALTPIEGDAVNLRTDANGALWVKADGAALESGGNLAAAATSLGVIDDTVYTGSATVISKYIGLGAYDEGDSGFMKPLVFHASTQGLQVTIAGSVGNCRVTGATSHDFSAAAAEPVATGGRAFAAAPTDVSADGDAVWDWNLRNGAKVINQSFAGILASTGTGASGTGTQRVVTSTDSTIGTLTGGGIAHDSADSGNPIKIGARAAATLSDDTIVSNADRVDAVADLDGCSLVRTGFPLGDLVSERVTDTSGTSTAFTNFGAVASTRNYITAIVVYNSSATAGTIDFRDGTAGSVLFTVPIPATGGAVITNGGCPLFRTSANTALAYDVSGALTTVTISISGFKSKV